MSDKIQLKVDKSVPVVAHFNNYHRDAVHMLMPATSTLEEVVDYVRTTLGDKVLHIVVKPEVISE